MSAFEISFINKQESKINSTTFSPVQSNQNQSHENSVNNEVDYYKGFKSLRSQNFQFNT